MQARFDAGLGTALDCRGLKASSATTSRQPELERAAEAASIGLACSSGKEPRRSPSVLEGARAHPAGATGDPVGPPVGTPVASAGPAARGAGGRGGDGAHRRGQSGLFPRFSISGELRPAKRRRVRPRFGRESVLVLRAGRALADPVRRTDPRQHPSPGCAAGAGAPHYEKSILIAVEEVENALSAQTREQLAWRRFERPSRPTGARWISRLTGTRAAWRTSYRCSTRSARCTPRRTSGTERDQRAW